MLAFQPEHAESRNQGPGQNKRSEHRKDDRLSHWSEEKLSYAGQTKDRDEDDTNTQRRNQCRKHDLSGSVSNRFQRWFSLADVAMNIFNGNGGVVHQDTYRQREPPNVIMLIV